MTNEQLYINGQLIELSEDTNIAQSFQANNIAEMQNRQGGYTNQFKVPKTAHNRQVLEHLDNVNSATNIPYQRNTARHLIDGGEVVREGVATVVSSDQFYTISVNSGNTDFFGAIPQDLKISDLIISGSEHTNDFDTIVSSMSNTSGFIYPMIDWFDDSKNDAFTDNTVDTKYLLPCLFVKDVGTALEVLTGWTLKGSLIDAPFYPNLILTPANLTRSDAQKLKYNATSKNSQNVTYAGTGATVVQYDTFGYGFDGEDYSSDSLIYGYMSFRGAVYWENTTGAGVIAYFRFRIWRSGVEVFCEDVEGQFVPAGQTGSFYFDAVSVNRVFNPADDYYTTIEPIGIPGFPTFEVDAKTVWTFNLIDGMPYGSLMPTVELYDMPVKELLQDIMNAYGVVPQSNSFRKEVYLNFFEDIQGRLSRAKKWSKYALPKTFSMTYKFGNYGRTNYLKYAEDSTVTAGIGDSFFNVEDATLPDTVTVIQMNTSATDEEVRYQQRTFPRIKALDYGSRSMTEVNYRLLVLDRQDVDYTIEFFDSNGNSQTWGQPIPFARAADLYFSNLMPVYYPTLQSMLRKAKPIKVDLLMSVRMIQELDFLDPVYFDVHHPDMEANGYFYLNKVTNYLKGKATLELIRL